MKPEKEDRYFHHWMGWLVDYGLKRNLDFDIDAYDKDILRDLFSRGFTTAKAYKELLSELPKPKEETTFINQEQE